MQTAAMSLSQMIRRGSTIWMLLALSFCLGFLVSNFINDNNNNLPHQQLPDSGEVIEEKQQDEPLKVINNEPQKPLEPEQPVSQVKFENCKSLPKDRNRKVTVPMADDELRKTLTAWNNKMLLRKVASSRPKMVFFMGLEGTGHHLIDTTFKDVCTMVSNHTVTPCRAATNVIPNYIGNIGYKWDFRKLSDNVSKHANFMKDINDQYKLTTDVMFLNSMRHHSEMFLDSALSYPDGGHPRIDNYPDVRFLAEMFEGEKKDFNIVLLLRDFDALMISTVLHRGFEPNFHNQGHIFEFMLEAMIAQLSKLDPKFIAGCIKLDSTKDELTMRLEQIDRNIQPSYFYFRELILKQWKQKVETVCINPDDFDSRLLYRLTYLNKKLASFCP